MTLQAKVCADCGKLTTTIKRTTLYIHHKVKWMGKHGGYLGGKELCPKCREVFEKNMTEATQPKWEYYQGEEII